MDGRFDVLIRGGLIADGSGGPLRTADVGVRDEVIAAIGNLGAAQAGRVIDASGMVVAPGFIDVHTHSDITILVDPNAESAIAQGVTTQVFPNCGMGLAPAIGEARRDVQERTAPFGIDVTWRTVGEYYKTVQNARPAVNVVPMVAQGTVRMAVMGYTKEKPSSAQLAEMKALVAEAMASGARGITSGLRYVPSGYADVAELAGLASVVRDYDGLYATHMRSEGDNGDWIEAIDEALDVGRMSGVRVQISHLKALGSESWGRSAEVMAHIAAATERDGVDVAGDQYPYTATSSTLFVLFPQWSQEGGLDSFLGRTEDAAQRQRMGDAFDQTLAVRGGPGRVVISQYSADPRMQGRTLADAADSWAVTPFDAAISLLRESEGHVSMIYHVLEEADVETIFRQPFVMVASDGSAVAPHGILADDYYPHPRNYGCFPRVLGEFVRERQLVGLGEAIRKMTSLPAQTFRIERRGEILDGWQADLTVFDPKTVADRATFDDPRAFPDGINHVFVNGQHVLDRGKHMGNRPGMVLYGSARRSVADA